MPKLIAPMSLGRVATLPNGTHAIGRVPGLAVQVRRPGCSLILSYVFAGKQHELGLGTARDLTPQSLDRVVTKAREARDLVKAGIDPIENRHLQRQAILKGNRRLVTFRTVAAQYIAKHASGWRNVKHCQQWVSTLKTYAEPLLGALPVDRIETAHLLEVLEPIWTSKTETATRVRQRVESILDFATANGYRDGPNPARWKGHLDDLLAAPAKLTPVKHFQALPWREVPTFMQRLDNAAGMGAAALRFTIMTAARSGDTRGMVWSEVDLDLARWTVPAWRTKTGREHRVPLATPALDLLRSLPRFPDVSHVFPSPRGAALSDMSLAAVLKRLDVPATVHGFRSSFRDWCSEATAHSRECAELALSHAIGSAVEHAYRRGDLWDKRVALMNDWGAFLAGSVPAV